MSIFVLVSCRKDSFITSADANLSISSDTLSFDTVFTSVGSVTQSFKIFNNNDQKLKLSSVKLAGGTSSPFKINIDGIASSELNDIEINKNDSIYVFVQVNVNPSSSSLPFILNDSIGIAFNGNQKWVQLQAYGQNAVFLKNKIIAGNETWTRTLPYVILGKLQVDSNTTLHIQSGTKIYLHADAPFIVDGTLKVNGTKDEPVIFSGDRLDEDYKDLPASWPGIIFANTSKNNSLTHATLKNAYQGIVATGTPGNSIPKVNLSKCRINNIYNAGILGINTDINADNCLISNCGSNVNLQGGNYRFLNCTVASYGTNFIAHTSPVLQLFNYSTDAGPTQTFEMNALFQNCIFWGDGGTVDGEIAIDKQGSSAFNATFDHVLYKAGNDIPNIDIIYSIKDEPPMFDSIDAAKNIFDFHFKNHPESPAVNSGTPTSFPSDLEDKPRDSKPDMGCYER